jgi:hypothetical protein
VALYRLGEKDNLIYVQHSSDVTVSNSPDCYGVHIHKRDAGTFSKYGG